MISIRDNHSVVGLGSMEIWDGADLCLLRETLARLVDTDGCKSIGVDLSHVKFIPGGFFGMLWDYADCGISVRLYSPQDSIKGLLWFREFFRPECEAVFRMHIPNATQTALAEPARERAKSLAGIAANMSRRKGID